MTTATTTERRYNEAGRRNAMPQTLPTKKPILEDYYTPDELAAELKLCREHILLMGRKKEIVPTKIGRNVLFHRNDVAAYLLKCRREK
jgi:excisionase family DNA binding protein